MADNRMWLIHRPTQLGIMLGKRMMNGWYGPPTQDESQRFFDYINEVSGSGDDFVLAMEDCRGSGCFDDWQYAPDFVAGFRKFIFTKPEERVDGDF